MRRFLVLSLAVALVVPAGTGGAAADEHEPTVVHPHLDVRTAASGLVTPLALAFLGPGDMLVTEKNTGRVRRIIDGAVHSTVLDLAVNSASERGLLGIELHPDFPADPGVYLFWTESTTGSDTNVVAETPLLGNRVDRFTWDGAFLSFDRNIVRLRAWQHDAGEPARGNHNGGVIRFGPDGKLHVFVGDVGRRGHLQNLPCGPTDTCPGPTVADDQFGGPAPDDAHLTGAVLRLDDGGGTPADNPFHSAGANIGGEVGANVQQLFSYGHRNAIGMAFDPESGGLWLAENADDAFTELNLVSPGMNGGWVQIMGLAERVAEYKAIETSPDTDPVAGGAYYGLQQDRWAPENIADTPEEAQAALFMLPGAEYRDPVFSWKYEVAPGGIGFMSGSGLGEHFDGDLFIGAARTLLHGGHLFRMELTGDRDDVAIDDSRLDDRVADNAHKFDLTESETLLFGTGFGVGTDIHTGPNGNLFVVSLSHGAVYEIFAKGVTSVEVTPSEASVAVDGTRQFTATATYDDATTSDVTDLATWTTDPAEVATVDDTGLATGASPGTATITATFDGTAGTATLTVAEDGTGPGPDPERTVRLSGPDRLRTAVAISRGAFDDGTAGAVVLARSDTYPDALAGTPLAVDRAAPTLLTPPAVLHAVTREEIRRVLPPGGTVYLLGGEAALRPAVESELQALGFQTMRLFGADRVETALAIVGELGDPDTLLITTGYNFADALAAGAAAAVADGAVLLTTAEVPHDSVSGYLTAHPEASAYAVGGPAARAYPAATPVFGAGREETAVAVAEAFFDDPVVLGFARRDDFPDALAGGAHLGRLGGPLLLTPTTSLHPAPQAYTCANTETLMTAYAYGGTSALSAGTLATITARLEGDGCT